MLKDDDNGPSKNCSILFSMILKLPWQTYFFLDWVNNAEVLKSFCHVGLYFMMKNGEMATLTKGVSVNLGELCWPGPPSCEATASGSQDNNLLKFQSFPETNNFTAIWLRKSGWIMWTRLSRCESTTYVQSQPSCRAERLLSFLWALSFLKFLQLHKPCKDVI